MKPEIEYVYNKLKQLRFDFKESDRKLFPNEYTFDCGLDRYIRVDGNDLYIDKNTFKPLEEELEYADKCHSLEERLDCSQEVVEKALKNGIYNGVPEYIGSVGLIYLPIFNTFAITCFDEHGKQTGCYPTREYKKTWWLRKDKSE